MTSGTPNNSTSSQPSSGSAESLAPIQRRRSRSGIQLIGFVCTLVIFFSLALLYYDQPSVMVQTIGLLIVILSLVLVMSGGLREVAALLLLTVFISTASVVAVTRDMAPFFAIGLPLFWLLGVFLAITVLWRSSIKVSVDEFVLIRSQINGQLYMLSETVEMPPIPAIEEIVARVPRYDLSHVVQLKDVPTRSTYRIPSVKVYVRFRIIDPLKLNRSQANRAKLYQEISKDLGFERRTALLQHRFWEELAQRALASPTGSTVRSIIWTHGEAGDDSALTYRPRQVFDNRELWAPKVRESLEVSARSNGLELIACRVIEVEIRETIQNEQTIEQQIAAEWKATQVATMVEKIHASLNSTSNQQLVETIKAALKPRDGEPPLTEEQVRRVVADALDNAQEQLSSRILERLARDGVLKQLEARGDLSREDIKLALVDAIRTAQGTNEQQLKELIMIAIDEADDRERTHSFFDRMERKDTPK